MSARGEQAAGGAWETWSGERETVAWSFDPRDGAVQGPLALGSFDGGAMLVRLAAGQALLLVHDGAPRRVWLDGTHLLRVGDEPGCVPSEALLFMLDTSATLACRWGEVSPLRLAGGGAARGACSFRIVAPARFYHAFLRHAETAGAGFVRRLLGALLQARLAETLADAPDAQAALERLSAPGPAVLAEGWDELGVACVAFSRDGAPAAPAPAPLDAAQPVAAS